MNSSSEHNIPWDLIISSLQKDAITEDITQLQQWISVSDKNKELFDQIKQIWEDGLTDYNVYQSADENAAWNSLRSKIENKNIVGNGNGKTVQGNFKTRRTRLMRWASVAAILILMTGSLIWYNAGTKNTVYQTSGNEERPILLADGSSIKLYSNSKIEVLKTYNKNDRVINFLQGEAFFEVKHNEQMPFIVDMGTSSVKDIGTSFYIHRTKDSTRISVKSGEVAFTNKQNNDIRKLSAGMNLQYQSKTNDLNSEASIIIDSSEAIANKNHLHFENTLLSDVIIQFREVYGKKIVLSDSTISQKRFTANLEGQSFEEAIKIVSKSLGIKYFKENDVYYLKNE